MLTDRFVERAHRVMSEGTATHRVDVGHLGAGAPMFAVLYTPAAAPIAGMVICPPLQSEFLVNYRREVLLARMLAARGFAVARFHYRGTGHSYGEDRNVTFGSMRRDAMEVASWLRVHRSVDVVAMLGTRLSALTAAAVASDRAEPIVLWEPIVEGDEYFREVFRFARMSGLARGADRAPLDEVNVAGSTDVVGFRIDRALVDSFRDRHLAALLGDGSPSVLLVQMDLTQRLRQEFAAFVDVQTRGGSEVDVLSVKGKEAWWFPGTQSHGSAQARNRVTVEATCDWLFRHVPAEAPR